jgi:hypothetical protein
MKVYAYMLYIRYIHMHAHISYIYIYITYTDVYIYTHTHVQKHLFARGPQSPWRILSLRPGTICLSTYPEERSHLEHL